MIEEYFSIYDEKRKQYGENTVVLYACGSFYEVYQVNVSEKVFGSVSEKVLGEKILGNAEKIAEILHIVYTSKNKNMAMSMSNPNFCGFGTAYVNKYLNILLENGYTVVIVDQLENKKSGKLVKRGVTAIHSPSVVPIDYETTDDLVLSSILIEKIEHKKSFKKELNYIVSVVSINNFTNDISVIEHNSGSFTDLLLEIERILLSNVPKEILLYEVGLQEDEKIELEKRFSIKIRDSDKKFKNYSKLNVQNEYFKKIYSSNNSLVSPIEQIGLNMYPLSIVNYMFLLDFILEHDIKLIKNINKPKIILENENLVLGLNTIEQLCLINKNKKSLFNIINKTSTPMGKRYLKKMLCRPFTNIEKIKNRYLFMDSIENDHLVFKEKLIGINDIEYYCRKMGLDSLHPYEMIKLKNDFLKINEIMNLLKENEFLQNDLQNGLQNGLQNSLQKGTSFKEVIDSSFNIEMMKDCSLKNEITNNFFMKGVYPEIDQISDEILSLEDKIVEIVNNYNKIIGADQVKVGFTDQEGHYFTMTKLRYSSFIKKLDEKTVQTFKPKFLSNNCKLFTEELDNISFKLIKLKKSLSESVIEKYLLKIKEISNNFNDYFLFCINLVEILDVCVSSLICKKTYYYCKPEITENNSCSIKGLRHPIIERLGTEYISNDIDLSSKNGYLLYGINSSGKSEFL